jgi:hypothetical protein
VLKREIYPPTNGDFEVPISPADAFKHHIIENWGGCGCKCYVKVCEMTIDEYWHSFKPKNISKYWFTQKILDASNGKCWCVLNGITSCSGCAELVSNM